LPVLRGHRRDVTEGRLLVLVRCGAVWVNDVVLCVVHGNGGGYEARIVDGEAEEELPGDNGVRAHGEAQGGRRGGVEHPRVVEEEEKLPELLG